MREALVKTEEFKDSPVGRIPKDWDVKTLRELSVGGISNGFFKKPELVGSGYRLVNVFDLYQDFGIDLSLVERVNATEQEQRKYSIQPGDCFFTRSSLVLSGIAQCNIIRDVPEPALFECHLMRLRPDKSQVIPEFLALWCRSPWARKFFMSRAKQVTMTTISQPDIAPLPVPLPSKSEQENIVEIHDAFNDAIAHTSSLIAKLKQMKAGLLHDLLTRGLDENGELRDAIAHPEQFKDSLLGRIPKDWKVSSVEGEFDITTGFTLGEHRRPRKNRRKYLRVANVQREEILLDDIAELEAEDREFSSRLLEKDDLLIVEGHANPDEIGRCAIVPTAAVGLTFQNHLFRLRCRDIDPKFALAWLNSEWVRTYWRRLCGTSSGLNTINRTMLNSIPVPIPEEKEQSCIIAVLDTYKKRIRAEEAYREKLKLQKQGLMHDLLTGKVRVKI